LSDNLSDVVASVQQAIVDILVKKTVQACLQYKQDKVIVVGGVSANSCLRAEMRKECEKNNFQVFFPKMQYCMDNGAMIGAAAIPKFMRKEYGELSLKAFSTKGIKKV
jgi:N6-L-threonylcarbamoyladenine synthase